MFGERESFYMNWVNIMEEKEERERKREREREIEIWSGEQD